MPTKGEDIKSSSVAASSEEVKPDNSKSQHTQVELPLPEGWESFVSRKNNKTFYHHKATNKTLWVRPTEPLAEKAIPVIRPESPPLPSNLDGQAKGKDITVPETVSHSSVKDDENKTAETEKTKMEVNQRKPPTGPSGASSVNAGNSTDNIASAYARRGPRGNTGAGGNDEVPRGPSGWRDQGGDKRRSRSISPNGRGDGKRFKGGDDDRRGGRSPSRPTGAGGYKGNGWSDRRTFGSLLAFPLGQAAILAT